MLQPQTVMDKTLSCVITCNSIPRRKIRNAVLRMMSNFLCASISGEVCSRTASTLSMKQSVPATRLHHWNVLCAADASRSWTLSLLPARCASSWPSLCWPSLCWPSLCWPSLGRSGARGPSLRPPVSGSHWQSCCHHTQSCTS
jgi:hypothetical protein